MRRFAPPLDAAEVDTAPAGPKEDCPHGIPSCGFTPLECSCGGEDDFPGFCPPALTLETAKDTLGIMEPVCLVVPYERHKGNLCPPGRATSPILSDKVPSGRALNKSPNRAGRKNLPRKTEAPASADSPWFPRSQRLSSHEYSQAKLRGLWKIHLFFRERPGICLVV